MSVLVVDASVAVKWYLPEDGEELSTQARALLGRHERDEISFVVPDLFYVEIARAIWKAVRIGRAPRSFADEALELLTQREFATVASLKLVDRAFQIAVSHNRTVYDSLYVALAIQAETHLVTADERLANALAAYYPVKWLGTM